MRHFKTTEIKPEPQFTCDGLTEEDRLAIAMDEAADVRPGECDERGNCLKGCGRVWPSSQWCSHCAYEWTGTP